MSSTKRGQNPLRVCMLTTRFYPDHGGGALQALRLCQALSRRGIKSLVIAGHKGQDIVADQVGDLSVTRLPLPAKEGLENLFFYARLLSLLITRRRNYDLIHAHAIHHHAYAGFLAGRLLRKPAIAKIAGTGADTPANVRKRRLGNIQVRLMSLATQLVVTSQELYDQTIKEGFPADRVVRIPNGTDTQLFQPVSGPERMRLRAGLGLPTEALIAIFVGAIRPVKGMDVLARVWPRLAKSTPDLHVYLVGPYREEEHWSVDSAYVEQLKHLFGLGNSSNPRIHFVGQVSNVTEYLQASDLFVFPSRSEGMPNALLEAMACGLPFVATRLGCIEEMAPPEQQPYLVPVDNADALAETITALARDPDARRQLGAAARQTVEERFSLDAVADRYATLYHQLLEK